MTAAELAQEADRIVADKEAELLELESQRRRARDITFKKSLDLTKMTNEDKAMNLELYGTQTGIRNLKSGRAGILTKV